MSAPVIVPPRTNSGNTPALPSFENETYRVLPTYGTPAINLQPIQVVGLIPVYPCDSDECRQKCTYHCDYKNPVFGDTTATEPSYENDFNSWLFNFPLIKNNPTGFTVTMTLEQYSGGTWSTAATLNSNTYGTFYNFGTVGLTIGSAEAVALHPTYIGYKLNWGKVLSLIGEGCYRFKVSMSFSTMQWNNNYLGEPTPVTVTDCAVTPVFYLKEFDCDKAHGTVKFEIFNTGSIGDPYTDYLKHNLCGIDWYDSIRVKGFFGKQKTPTYKTENNKWGTPNQGKIERVRDEQIQQWEYKSGLLPEYIHTRFSTFAMMTDKTFVSDYNINNSDWTISRKNVIKAQGANYEPNWLDETADWQKRDKADVVVPFERGVQSVEKFNCC